MRQLSLVIITALIAGGCIFAFMRPWHSSGTTPDLAASTAEEPTTSEISSSTIAQDSPAEPGPQVAPATAGPMTPPAARSAGPPSAQPAAAKPAKTHNLIGNLSAHDAAVRDQATAALIRQAQADPSAVPSLLDDLRASRDSASPEGRLRALYVIAQLNGAVHVEGDADQGNSVLLAGLHYLESHLNDPAIANFAPQENFSHVGVMPMDDGQWAWLLDDISTSRGINLLYDPARKQIVKAATWPASPRAGIFITRGIAERPAQVAAEQAITAPSPPSPTPCH